MSTLRCEEMEFSLNHDAYGQTDKTGNAVITRIGLYNKTTTPIPATSDLVMAGGPGARNVVVRAFGGAALVSKSSPATVSNSHLIKQDDFAIIRLGESEALYGVAATIG